jgi:hypothetical protein
MHPRLSNKHASRLFDDALQFSGIVVGVVWELQDEKCGSLSRKAIEPHLKESLRAISFRRWGRRQSTSNTG